VIKRNTFNEYMCLWRVWNEKSQNKSANKRFVMSVFPVCFSSKNSNIGEITVMQFYRGGGDGRGA